MKFAITIYAVAVLTMLGCTTLEVGRYEAALVGDTWQRVDLNTGDVCITDLYGGEWVCTQELNMLWEFDSLEEESFEEPEWFNSPFVSRGEA